MSDCYPRRIALLLAALTTLLVFANSCASTPKWDAAKLEKILEMGKAVVTEGHGAVDLAQDDRFLVRGIPIDSVEALAVATSDLEAMGRPVVPSPLGRVITRRSVVNVPLDWESRPIRHQAVIIWHERCHSAWRDHLTDPVFEAIYAIASGRWALETVCGRQEVVAGVALGLEPNELINRIAERTFGHMYALGELRDNYYPTTIAALRGVLDE